jgi:hypothetical protein
VERAAADYRGRERESAAGRVQGTPTQDKLDIGFEELEDGTIPTFTFVQKNEKGDDKYYFEQDTNGDISYAGEYYTITYQDQDERTCYTRVM